ncbi:TPA: hypothetical protein KPJ62_003697 [Clostridioides difficile]|nr:hypothetical protein [Clostridioides difficile]
MYKYTLIVSRYYYSCHTFIVRFEENDFIENYLNFAKELYTYMKGEDDIKKLDLSVFNGNRPKRKYIVKDIHSELYIISSPYIDYFKGIAKEYEKKALVLKRFAVSEKIKNIASNNHSYNRIEEIVNKYFTIRYKYDGNNIYKILKEN